MRTPFLPTLSAVLREAIRVYFEVNKVRVVSVVPPSVVIAAEDGRPKGIKPGAKSGICSYCRTAQKEGVKVHRCVGAIKSGPGDGTVWPCECYCRDSYRAGADVVADVAAGIPACGYCVSGEHENCVRVPMGDGKEARCSCQCKYGRGDAGAAGVGGVGVGAAGAVGVGGAL